MTRLVAVGLDPKEEALLESSYRIDAMVEVNGEKVCVEVDSPFHFMNIIIFLL